MLHLIGKAAALCAVAATLAVALATPSEAYRYRAYRGYAYVPQYDTSGALIDPRGLGWQGGRPSGAPANPCTIGRAQQNRC
jgi:hypothetical protein